MSENTENLIEGIELLGIRSYFNLINNPNFLKMDIKKKCELTSIYLKSFLYSSKKHEHEPINYSIEFCLDLLDMQNENSFRDILIDHLKRAMTFRIYKYGSYRLDIITKEKIDTNISRLKNHDKKSSEFLENLYFNVQSEIDQIEKYELFQSFDDFFNPIQEYLNLKLPIPNHKFPKILKTSYGDQYHQFIKENYESWMKYTNLLLDVYATTAFGSLTEHKKTEVVNHFRIRTYETIKNRDNLFLEKISKLTVIPENLIERIEFEFHHFYETISFRYNIYRDVHYLEDFLLIMREHLKFLVVLHKDLYQYYEEVCGAHTLEALNAIMNKISKEQSKFHLIITDKGKYLILEKIKSLQTSRMKFAINETKNYKHSSTHKNFESKTNKKSELEYPEKFKPIREEKTEPYKDNISPSIRSNEKKDYSSDPDDLTPLYSSQTVEDRPKKDFTIAELDRFQSLYKNYENCIAKLAEKFGPGADKKTLISLLIKDTHLEKYSQLLGTSSLTGYLLSLTDKDNKPVMQTIENNLNGLLEVQPPAEKTSAPLETNHTDLTHANSSSVSDHLSIFTLLAAAPAVPIDEPHQETQAQEENKKEELKILTFN